MNAEIERMLGKYDIKSVDKAIHALKEVIQEVVLQILSQTDFFQHAAFYGGTALRIFYGLNRFSEDMDFSLQSLEPDFSLQKHLPVLEQGLHSFGFTMQAQEKQKQQGAPVQSAFPKGNTRMHLLHIAALPFPYSGVPSNALLSIKVEIDTNPPPGAQYETKFRLLPQPYSVVLYDKPSLFAGKLHALLCRNWKHREKGRDFYDYVWYLQEHIPVNLEHLQARMHQSGHWDSERSLSLPIVIDLLEQRFTEVDYESVKADVLPFIPNANVLDIWSKEFFIAITKDLLTANA